MTSELQTGNTWHWRVRATSATNQIGNWSDSFHFLLPDITTWSIDSNTAAVELHHRQAMPALNLPNFIDTWVADSGVGATADQSSSSTFKVGTTTNGENATALIKIPLTELPNPQNAHISDAVLNMYAQFGSDTGNAVSIHPALVAWNTSANGTTYDGINNWSSPGAMGANDRGAMSDVQQGASADWMEFDVTELVQDAFANGESHLSLMIVGSIGEGQTIFSSTDGLASERPWLNLTGLVEMHRLLKLLEQTLTQQLMKSFGIPLHTHCFLEQHQPSHGATLTHQTSMIGEFSSGKITMTKEQVGQCMTVGILLKVGTLPI